MAVVAAFDAHSLIYRSWHAVNRSSDSAVALEPVLAALLSKLLRHVRPQYVIGAADAPGGSFRKDIAADYKQGRSAPEHLLRSVPLAIDALRAAGVPVVEAPGFEADDILATLAGKVRDGHRLVVISSDGDLAGLVGERVDLLWVRSGGKHRLLTADGPPSSEIAPGLVGVQTMNVREAFGVPAERIVEYKALVGDKSDNIAGVKGVGPKAACALIGRYPTWEALLAGIDDEPGAVGRKLQDGREDLLLSHRLACMRTDVPCDLDARAAVWTQEKAAALLRLDALDPLAAEWD